MSALDPVMARADAIKARLDFSDAAEALGLSPVVAPGGLGVRCDCPVCGSPRAVALRGDDQGGRCTVRDCRRGFSIVTLAMAAKGLDFGRAVSALEGLAPPPAADPRAPDLFSEKPGFSDSGEVGR